MYFVVTDQYQWKSKGQNIEEIYVSGELLRYFLSLKDNIADMFVTASCLIYMQDSMYPCTCKVSFYIRRYTKYFCYKKLRHGCIIKMS